MIRKLKCNACEYEGEMKILFTNISDIGDREVILCPNCGLEFLYPPLTEEDKSKIYDVDNYAGWGNDNPAFISMKKDKFRKVVKSILKYKNSGKLLDVGCGLGYLLEVANEMGFDSYGVELSKNGSDMAKKKFGEDKIYNGTVETCKWKNTFDVITMNDLFEHIDNPVETLEKSKELLTSRGGGGVYSDYNS
ncbi:class I SAM-dependent methyltransferase [uncultured Brachyspira sp.]|uniref:class I SAM-dependent methyltransferase n=1 Tax=uncultured Brachyspira sp. TaxID=221953 RepID=UPI0026005C60|nr:class I SAM-dependent methyltransferase [uncultured Brachyspira sp.]